MALCISGTFRTAWECHKSHFKNIVNAFPGQVDIYLQSYISDEAYQVWWAKERKDSTWNMASDIIDLYKPKAVCFEEMEPLQRRLNQEYHVDLGIPYWMHNNYAQLQMQYLGIKTCYELASKQDNYDAFFRCRYDSWYFEPVDFSENWQFKDEHIMISRGEVGSRSGKGGFFSSYDKYRTKMNPFYKINDQSWWAGAKPYAYLASLVDYVKAYCDPETGKTELSPEGLYWRHMISGDSEYTPVIEESIWQRIIRDEDIPHLTFFENDAE